AETNGLNQLPKHLYPHGTAVVSTLQPLAGEIGVSVFIGLLNSRQASYLSSAENPESRAVITDAMVYGVESVYFIIFIIAIIAAVMSFFVYRATPIEDLVAPPDKK